MHRHSQRLSQRARCFTVAAVALTGVLPIQGFAREMVQMNMRAVLSISPQGESVSSMAAFRVPGESQQTTDAVADFEQLLTNKQWDKAFRAMETFQSANPVPMVRTANDFVMPVDLYGRRRLASLPPDGRQAFRVFYDAQAKALLEKPEGSSEELAALEKVYQKYLISSYGPAAADRLGDTYFERGDFSQAAKCWADIITYCPDSTISVARLYVKQATALARAGDWTRFDQIQQRVQTRYPGEKVVIGGGEVAVTEYLTALAKERASDAADAAGLAAASNPVPDKIPLPKADVPAWKYEFFNENLRQQVAVAFQNRGYGSGLIDNLRPEAVNDETRVYINWFGLTAAIDAKTGKVIWQSDKSETIAQRVQQMVNYGIFNSGAMLLDRGLIFSTGYEQNRMPYLRIACYDAASGKLKWNTSGNSGLGEYFFLGSPVIEGDVVYCTALKQMRGELNLVAMSRTSGTKLWELALGNPTQNPNGGYNVDLEPQIEATDDQIFVLTNDGALVAVDPVEKRLAWAYMYGEGRKIFSNRFRRRGAMPPTGGRRGDLPIEHGILYFKDKGQEELHAVNINDRSILWTKEIGSTDALLGIIDGELYVLGDALTTYKPSSLERRWWSELFGKNVDAPLFTQSQVYLYGTAGLFDIDRKTGKITQMLTEFDTEPTGGSVLAVDQTLILITDTTVVGYRTAAP